MEKEHIDFKNTICIDTKRTFVYLFFLYVKDCLYYYERVQSLVFSIWRREQRFLIMKNSNAVIDTNFLEKRRGGYFLLK